MNGPLSPLNNEKIILKVLNSQIVSSMMKKNNDFHKEIGTWWFWEMK